MTLMQPTRALTTRLPSDLFEHLERERYARSRVAGRRISTRMMVEFALREMLAHSGGQSPPLDQERPL